MVASDRISAFDVIMAEPIPDKGRVLTAMTAYWLEELVRPGPQPPDQRRHGRLPRRGGRPPRRAGRAGRPLDAGPPGRDARHRVHRPRLPGRLGLQGVRAGGHRPRHGHARRPPPRRPAARAHLHPLDQGHRGPRPQHRDGRGHRPGGQGGGRGRRPSSAWPPTPGPRPGPRSRASSSATPSSSWASSTAPCPSATRC